VRRSGRAQPSAAGGTASIRLIRTRTIMAVHDTFSHLVVLCPDYVLGRDCMVSPVWIA
jgi:hypothetical protein